MRWLALVFILFVVLVPVVTDRPSWAADVAGEVALDGSSMVDPWGGHCRLEKEANKEMEMDGSSSQDPWTEIA